MGCCHSNHAKSEAVVPIDEPPRATEIAMAWNPWICTCCRNITFRPMKLMTPERWRSYFPFLGESTQFEEEYELRYQKFIDLVPNEHVYGAILCQSRQDLYDNAVDEDCSFCWLLDYIIQTECYWSSPTRPGTDTRAGIIAWPPVEWPDDDIDDHRRSSPLVWLEVSLRPGNPDLRSSINVLEDAIVTVKLGNVLSNPRFLLNNITDKDSGWDAELEDIRELDNDTGSAQNIVLAKRWLTACQEHPNCSNSGTGVDQEIPSRLLDLAVPGLDEDLLLYETSPADKSITYATLSHRWGSALLTTTTTSNLQKHLTRISLESLPKTFREAIIFTRKMGVRYLWIDSLCIIQDSSDDKDREIPKMASIYSNAIFNIAASAASDSSEGLFRERQASLFQPIELPLNFELADGTKKTCFATFSRLLDRSTQNELKSTLDSRGWIFQERALSKRVFSFDNHMLWFECRQMIASESLPRGAARGLEEDNSSTQDKWLELLPESASRSLSLIGDLLSKAEKAKQENDPVLPTQIQTLLHNWYRAIPGYLLRSFTHETDRLPAISSLASRISGLSPEKNTYLAGHFRPNLLLSLCWALGSQSSPHSPVRFQPPRAPTWSWASLTGPVRTDCFLLPEHAPQRMLLELVDAWTTTPANDSKPYGDVKEGGIKIRGWMKKMAAWSVAAPGGTREQDYGVASIFEVDSDFVHGGLYVRGGVGRAHMDEVGRFVGGPEERREVWVVPVMVYEPERNQNWQGKWEEDDRPARKVCALVLEERGDGQFERVGFMWRLLMGATEEWEGEHEDEGGWFEKGKVEREIVVV